MRVASLQPSITLTLAALGRLDVLCACTKYCLEALPELAALDLPVLLDSWSSSAEELQSVSPDLVVASVPYRMESLTAILKAGLPVLLLAPRCLEDVYGDIALLARMVEARLAGEKVIAQMRERVDAARGSVASARRPLVYCEEWGKPLIHSQRWVAEMVEAAGGVFLGKPGSQTTAETIADADPEVLVFAWCGAGSRVPLEKMIAQRGWEGLRAVREGRVVCIPDELLNTPAPSLLGGLACLGAVIHPERFADDSRLVWMRREGFMVR